MTSIDRLSINQATVKRATLPETIDAALKNGVGAIGTWREPVGALGLREACARIADSGVRVSSHCRGGFLTDADPAAWTRALDANRRAIDETAALTTAAASGSSAVLVLVCGGLPKGSRDIVGARARVLDGIVALAPHAESAGVQLAVEPLHPMYAADRSVVTSLREALDIAAGFPSHVVGVVVDAFHVWWDSEVETQIARAGCEGRLAAYQVCDWRVPLESDPLLSRHYPGEGVVDLRALTQAVVRSGYDRDIEVEIFNQSVWDDDPADVIGRCVAGFEEQIASVLREETANRDERGE